MSVEAPATQVTVPDGRVGLVDPATLADCPYANAELAPVPVKKRTWSTYNFAALWMGMAQHPVLVFLVLSLPGRSVPATVGFPEPTAPTSPVTG